MITRKISLTTLFTILFAVGIMLLGGSLISHAKASTAPTLQVEPTNGIQGKDGWSSSPNWKVTADIQTDHIGADYARICAQLDRPDGGENCQSLGNVNSTYPTATFFSNVNRGDITSGTPDGQAPGKPGIYKGEVWLSGPEEWIDPGKVHLQTVEYKFDNEQPAAPSVTDSRQIDENAGTIIGWDAPSNKPISGIENYRYQLDNQKEVSSSTLSHTTNMTDVELTAEQIKEALQGSDTGTVYLHVQAVSGAAVNGKVATTEIKVSNDHSDTPPADDNTPPADESRGGGNTTDPTSPAAEQPQPTLAATVIQSPHSGSVKVLSRRIKLRYKGMGRIRINCVGESACKGKIALHGKAGDRKILVAMIPYNLSNGMKETIEFRTNKAARKVLKLPKDAATLASTLVEHEATITSE